MKFNFFGGIDNLNNLSTLRTLGNNRENYKDNDNSGFTTILIIIIVIYLILFVWTIYVLATFNLPQEILVLCIVLLIIIGPVVPLILAYVFKDKKIQ
jgi:uncharacterized membrane-anchored protein